MKKNDSWIGSPIELKLNGNRQIKKVYGIRIKTYCKEMAEEVKKFLEKYLGENSSWKVYENRNGAFGILAVDPATGVSDLKFAKADSWVLVVTYASGGKDVMIMHRDLKSVWFSDYPHPRRKKVSKS